MRKIVAFPCAGEELIGSFDDADGTTGLLVVSGGNEVRAGAHRGMAMLARRLAEKGNPVFRFDRRGVGDSSGANMGHMGARPDIEAAVACFRHHAPQLRRIVGFGNCDAATSLLLFGDGIDRLVIANPWLRDDGDGLPPVEAIKAHYAERVRDPSTWARAFGGGVNFRKLASGVAKIATNGGERRADVEAEVFAALAERPSTDILIAERDATGIAFMAAAERRGFSRNIRLIDTESHSFARAPDKVALHAAIRAALDAG
jgi:exosortase A-associated hydrolase 1